VKRARARGSDGSGGMRANGPREDRDAAVRLRVQGSMQRGAQALPGAKNRLPRNARHAATPSGECAQAAMARDWRWRRA